jgi:putative transposase
VQRGRERAPCFSCASDRVAYLAAVRTGAGESGSAVHAYALMGNHVHLLVTPGRVGGAGALLERAAGGYARYLERAYGHESDVWDERYDGTPVRPRQYLLACMRYIDLNPVRAGIVAEPGAYRWSSYRANAEGAEDALVTPHPAYFALGRSSAARQAAYRALLAASGAGGLTLLAESRSSPPQPRARMAAPTARTRQLRRKS